MSYSAEMPFIATASNGGAYDDAAYIAGYEAGVLAGQLRGDISPSPENPGPPSVTDWRWARADNLRQMDLLAMQHGYAVEVGETHEDLVAIRLTVGGA